MNAIVGVPWRDRDSAYLHIRETWYCPCGAVMRSRNQVKYTHSCASGHYWKYGMDYRTRRNRWQQVTV